MSNHSPVFDSIKSLKISLFSNGLNITPAARQALTHEGTAPFAMHEYATTSGITLIIEDLVWVNAPYDEPFCDHAEAILLYHETLTSPFSVVFRNETFSVQPIPLPGYLGILDSAGRPITHTTFSHGDRVRLSPIYGCAFACTFCDIAGKPYNRRPLGQLLEGLALAKTDSRLPVHHALISGGTPSPRDYDYFDNLCAGVITAAEMPVDIMMPPRPTDTNCIRRWTESGIHGFSINLEIVDDDIASHVTPQKHRVGLPAYIKAIEEAVKFTGGHGRVRSLLLVGLESVHNTLAGVDLLARIGCDPVLSPFRPDPGTPMANMLPPDEELLREVYFEAENLVAKHGVKLGPRCIPCQHNTLSFPEDISSYYYSSRNSP